MGYVQGTTVRVQADFSDSDGTALTPTEVTLKVHAPGAASATSYLLSAGDVFADGVVTGRYYRLIDTASAHGTWDYQFAGTDGTSTIVVRGQIAITEDLT